MNRSQSNLFKTVLYIVGSFIIILGMLFIKFPGVARWETQYVWISMFLIYTACFFPFLLNIFRDQKFNSLLTGGAVYYRGAGVYIAAVIALSYMALSGIGKHSTLVIGQLAALFLLAIYVYLSLASAQHTANVQVREQRKTAKLNEIKNLMKQIEAAAEALDGTKLNISQKIKKAAGEIQYLSPSDNQQAIDLEYQIHDLLDEVSYNLEQMNSDSEKTIMQDLDQIVLLCSKRKNIY